MVQLDEIVADLVPEAGVCMLEAQHRQLSPISALAVRGTDACFDGWYLPDQERSFRQADTEQIENKEDQGRTDKMRT